MVRLRLPKALALLVIGFFCTLARGWSEEDLRQQVTLSCELSVLERFQDVNLAQASQVAYTPALKVGMLASGIYELQTYRALLRVLDGGAYLAILDTQGKTLSELIRPEFLANHDIWITHRLTSEKELRWFCSYRAQHDRDLSLLHALSDKLALLVKGLDELSDAAWAAASPSLPQACFNLGIAMMRGQDLAERSSTPASGWLARRECTELRDLVIRETAKLCRAGATVGELRPALERIYLGVASARSALSPPPRSEQR